jgi:hypothetical protein
MMISKGKSRAMPYLRRLVVGFPPRRTVFEPRSCGICGGQISTRAGFLRVVRFPLPILIPPTTPHSSSGAGTIGQIVADVPSGPSLTPPRESKRKGGGESRNAEDKPGPLPVRPSLISHEIIRNWTRTSAVRLQLSAWAMTAPYFPFKDHEILTGTSWSYVKKLRGLGMFRNARTLCSVIMLWRVVRRILVNTNKPGMLFPSGWWNHRTHNMHSGLRFGSVTSLKLVFPDSTCDKRSAFPCNSVIVVERCKWPESSDSYALGALFTLGRDCRSIPQLCRDRPSN